MTNQTSSPLSICDADLGFSAGSGEQKKRSLHIFTAKPPSDHGGNDGDPVPVPIADDMLDQSTGGGGDAYFVRCDRTTMTQSDQDTSSRMSHMPGMHKHTDITLKRG